MTINNRYGNKVFRFMLDIANDNGIPVKRVETIFLLKILVDNGFTCEHVNMGIRNTDKKPYCKDCWTIFRQIKWARSVNGILEEAGEYVRERTFLDKNDSNYKEEIFKLAGPSPKFRPRYKTSQVPYLKGISSRVCVCFCDLFVFLHS